MGWITGFHVVGIILWMGGLVTLARLLGHHSGLDSVEARESLISFERKSYFFAILPGFVVTLLTGIYLLLSAPKLYLAADGPWGATFHLKLTLVLVLIALDQAIFWKMRRLHADGEGSRGFFMAAHGIVGLLFIVIVLIVKSKVLGG